MPYFTKCKHNKRLIQRDSPSLRFSNTATQVTASQYPTSSTSPLPAQSCHSHASIPDSSDTKSYRY